VLDSTAEPSTEEHYGDGGVLGDALPTNTEAVQPEANLDSYNRTPPPEV
jgi:hypothetical protein